MRLKPGDIFKVPLDSGRIRFFQYILDDSSLFNSNVIRGFKIDVSEDDQVDLGNIVSSDVLFHAHTVIKAGVKVCNWHKIGNVSLPEHFCAPMFKSTHDVLSRVTRSNNWRIWRPNGVEEVVGSLPSKYKHLDFGAVTHPIDITNWLKNGHHDFSYPD